MERKLNNYYNELENLNTLEVICIGRHVKQWKDLIIKLNGQDITNNYDEVEYYVDEEKSILKLINNKENRCDIITKEIKKIFLENKYFSIISDNNSLNVSIYNKRGEEVLYHNIHKLIFNIKKDDVGIWNLEMF